MPDNESIKKQFWYIRIPDLKQETQKVEERLTITKKRKKDSHFDSHLKTNMEATQIILINFIEARQSCHSSIDLSCCRFISGEIVVDLVHRNRRLGSILILFIFQLGSILILFIFQQRPEDNDNWSTLRLIRFVALYLSSLQYQLPNETKRIQISFRSICFC